MRIILILLPILLVVGCSRPTVYIPESYRVKNKSEAPKDDIDMEASIITAGEKEKHNFIQAPYADAWKAALESVNWVKWNVAFIDENEGVIRLKEAYVYRKSGKLLRSYTFPSQADINRSNINDYLEKVAKFRPSATETAFTQENLKITLTKVSDDKTEIIIDYNIRPYTFDGKIGYEVMSDGYIEHLILDRMQEDLSGKPVAMN